jgi:hypothetical protein
MTLATAFIRTHLGLLMYLRAYKSRVCLCWTTRTWEDDSWVIKEIRQASEERYLSKSAFSDTSEEYKMEEVDICVKVDDL